MMSSMCAGLMNMGQQPKSKPDKKVSHANNYVINIINYIAKSINGSISILMFLEEPHLAQFKKLRHEYEQKFRELLDKGMKKGDFKKGNSKLAVFTIFSALNATYDLYRANERLTAEQIGDEIADILLKGITGVALKQLEALLLLVIPIKPGNIHLKMPSHLMGLIITA